MAKKPIRILNNEKYKNLFMSTENPVEKIMKYFNQETGFIMPQTIQDCLDTNGIFVMQIKGKTVGMVLFKLRKDFNVALKHIKIDEKYRNKGYGSYLLKFLIKYSEIKYYDKIVLKSTNNNKNHSFYLRHGFETTTYKPQFFGKKNKENYTYFLFRLENRIKYRKRYM